MRVTKYGKGENLQEVSRKKFFSLRNLEVTLDDVSVASTSKVSTAAMLVFVMT